MEEQKNNESKKGFLKKLMEKLDRKLEEKARKTSCCCNPPKNKGDSCCG